MAPKKKGNKKAQDDWEAELGETIAPVAESADAADTNDAAAAAAPEGEEEGPAPGGLMGIMRKRKEKRKDKGLSEDFPAAETETAPAEDLAAKAPQEATLDDEFALPEKKGKGGKGNNKQQAATAKPDDDDEADASGRVLTKAEKEKIKKEREKQRKKENVGRPAGAQLFVNVASS